MILRKTGDEPIAGMVMATYVPKDIFYNFSSFSDFGQSLKTLDDLILQICKKVPHRYKGMKKKPDENKLVLNYENTNSDIIKSNSLSIMGGYLDSVVVEPGNERICAVKIDIGFAYAHESQSRELLEIFDRDFILLTDPKTFQPIIILDKKDGEVYSGNLALYLIFGRNEFTVANKDGESIRKKSYVLVQH